MFLIALAQRFVSEDPPFAKGAKDGAPAKPAPLLAKVLDPGREHREGKPAAIPVRMTPI